MTTLFDPIKIGALELPNRIIMAPLTRARAIGPGRVPNALMAEYYVQRASAGLILTEATSVTPMGVGYADTPGIWSDEQVAGWKQITDAVHAAGGRIVLQLWHVGRISDPVFLDGAAPVAPSAVKPAGPSAWCARSATSSPRARWRRTRSPASSPPTAGAPRMRSAPASTASRSTAPTAICSTSSCKTAPTCAPTNTAARSKTARA